MTDDHTHRGDDVHSVEAAAREANGGWQPIETAPKAGYKSILVCQFQNGIVTTACWNPVHSHWSTGAGPMSFIADVTHWMPLPAAPTEGKHLTTSEE
jgi:hypothetical protein